MDGYVDHLGVEHASEGAMCRAWGVPQAVYAMRVRQLGWAKGRALTTPAVRDHTGRGWPSFAAMCRHWGVSDSTVRSRLRRGLTMREALGPADVAGSCRTGRPCRDHLGTEHSSVTAMCRHWGVSPDLFRMRRLNGWALADALTIPPVRGGRPTSCEDHLGDGFPSVTAMCRHWGVSTSTFRSRMARGMSLEDALRPSTESADGFVIRARPCSDHLGNHYASVADMCRAWGLSVDCLYSRVGRGWPLERALTEPSRSVQAVADAPAVSASEGRFLKDVLGLED